MQNSPFKPLTSGFHSTAAVLISRFFPCEYGVDPRYEEVLGRNAIMIITSLSHDSWQVTAFVNIQKSRRYPLHLSTTRIIDNLDIIYDPTAQ